MKDGGMNTRNIRVCPVEKAGGLDIFLRRWLQNPWKILSPYVKAGMTVLDFGCGPGYFTIDMARMVGGSGRVIAADLQAGMLDRLKRKIKATGLEERIILHHCEENKIGLSEKVDFVLAFYVVHEIPDQGAFFKETEAFLRPSGRILVVEPPFHVSASDFEATLQKALNAGLRVCEKPKVMLSKSVILKKIAATISRSGIRQ